MIMYNVIATVISIWISCFLLLLLLFTLLYCLIFFSYCDDLGGIPRVKWSGVDAEDNILIIDLLGPSLEDLFVYCGRKFSLKTTLMLADQMVQISLIFQLYVLIWAHACPAFVCYAQLIFSTCSKFKWLLQLDSYVLLLMLFHFSRLQE